MKNYPTIDKDGYMNLHDFLSGDGFNPHLSNSLPTGVGGSYYNGSNDTRESFVWRCTGGCDSGNAPLDMISAMTKVSNTTLIIGSSTFNGGSKTSPRMP